MTISVRPTLIISNKLIISKDMLYYWIMQWYKILGPCLYQIGGLFIGKSILSESFEFFSKWR